MENSVCKISWKLVENWLRNPRNSLILVDEFNVNLSIWPTTVTNRPNVVTMLALILVVPMAPLICSLVCRTLCIIIPRADINYERNIMTNPRRVNYVVMLGSKGRIWHIVKCYIRRFKTKVLISNFFNPLSPHDALKHHITSLKTDLIFL